MSATLVHRGPDSDGAWRGRAGRPRGAAPLDHRPRDRRPAAHERGRLGRRRPERRDLQLPRAARRARGAGPPLPHARRHGGARAPLRAARRRLRRARCAGMFAVAIWDARERNGSSSHATASGSSRSTTAPTAGGLEFASELRALPRGEVDLDALEAFLAFNSVPAPLSILRGTRKLPPGHLLVWEGGEPRLERFARPAPVAADAVRREPRGRAGGGAARAGCATRCAPISSRTCRSACSSPAGSTRALLAAFAAEALRRAGAHVHDRLPRTLVRRDGGRAARRRALRHRPSRARPRAGRGAAPAGAGRGVRRAVRRLVRAADLPRLRARGRATSRSRSPARAATSSSAATRPTRPTCSRSAPASLARLARPLVERLPVSTAKASFDYRRSASSGPRTCRRSSATTAGRRSSRPTAASGADRDDGQGFDPVDGLRARYAETEGAELLARLQDVDLGTYLVDDLLVKTDRASMAHSLEARVPFLDTAVADLALALPTRLKVRGLRKKVLLRKAAEPLLPAEIVQRPQARLLDPGRGLAARRAGAVRARRPLGGHDRGDRATSGRPR